MDLLFTDFMDGFVRLANDGWERNWHERNSGNLTYRLKDDEIDSVWDVLNPGAWHEIGCTVENLAGEYFLVTGEAISFREIMSAPEENVCMLELDEGGSRYRIVWGLVRGGEPTRSLPLHLMMHEKKKATGRENRVVYHAHPGNLVTLTYRLPLQSDAFCERLVQMNEECENTVRRGVSILSGHVTGREKTDLTAAAIGGGNSDIIIWAHHGIMVSGRDFNDTFGMLHALEKAAEMLLKLMILDTVKP